MPRPGGQRMPGTLRRSEGLVVQLELEEGAETEAGAGGGQVVWGSRRWATGETPLVTVLNRILRKQEKRYGAT